MTCHYRDDFGQLSSGDSALLVLRLAPHFWKPIGYLVSRFTLYGTHQGTFMGIPATGRRIAVKGVVIDRVVDGKWKDSRIMMDDLALLQQLGALPATPTSQIA